MANEFRVKNGLIIDEVSAGEGVLTIANSNISSDDGSIEVTVIDGQTVTLGKTGSHANIVVAPHGTAANEKITALNTSGTADDAILLDAAAGGITLRADDTANGKRIHIESSFIDTTNQQTTFQFIGGTGVGSGNTNALRFINGDGENHLTFDTTNERNVMGKNLVMPDGGIIGSSTDLNNLHFKNNGGITVGSSTQDSASTGLQVNSILSNADYSEARVHVGVAEGQMSGLNDTTYPDDLVFFVAENSAASSTATAGSGGLVISHGNSGGGSGTTWGVGTSQGDSHIFTIGFYDGDIWDELRGKPTSPFNTATANDKANILTLNGATGTHTMEVGRFFGSTATAGSFQILDAGSDNSPNAKFEFTSGGEFRFYEQADSEDHYTGFKAPDDLTGTSNYIYELPAGFPTGDRVLQSDSSGVLTWVSAAASGASTLDELTDVSFSGGDLTITGLTTISSGAIVHDSSGKITLDSNTGDIAFAVGGTEQLAIDMDTTAGEIAVQLKVDSDDLVFKQYDGTEVLRLGDNGEVEVKDNLRLTSDSSVFAMGADNDVTITHDGSTGATLASTGDFIIDTDGDITLDANGADVTLKDGGTTYGSLTNAGGQLVIRSGSSPTTAITMSDEHVTIAGNLTVSGTTTAVNTTNMTVEDAIIELGLVDGSAPSSQTSIDFGMIVNYHDNVAARKAAFFYDNDVAHWAIADIVTESTQVLSPTANATGLRWYYDTDNHFTIGVGADGATTMTTVDSNGNAGNLTITADGVLELDSTGSNDIILDSAQDIQLNVAGNDINLKSGSDGFGSLTNSSGDLQIKAASGKGIELRSNTDLEFVIEDDAGTDQSTFLFHTESTAGTDLTGVDNEAAPVTMVYKSNATELGKTEFGKVQQAGTGTTNQIFQFASGTFSVAEVTLHATDGSTQQANKMVICADATNDEVAFSNYSEVYSDGSTKLVDYAVAISSDTVTLSFDGDDDDIVTYAVTFLA